MHMEYNEKMPLIHIHAHPSHAHIIMFHMSLTHWVNFELKCFSQFLLQCLVVSSPMDGANESNLQPYIFHSCLCTSFGMFINERNSIPMNVIHERGRVFGWPYAHKPKGFLFVTIRTLHSKRFGLNNYN